MSLAAWMLFKEVLKDTREKNDGELSILIDREFEGRKALEAKRKDLRKKRKGAKLQAAEALAEAEENTLWVVGGLGDTNPTVLLHSVWYLCTMHFGWRGVDEHRRVRYGDITWGVDSEGGEYIELKIERGTKTRNGLEGQQNRAYNPTMYATESGRCPVKILNKYMSLRPAHACLPDFYLQPATVVSDLMWYKNQPVSVNKLCKLWKSWLRRQVSVSGN